MRGLPWFRLDVDFVQHPKCAELALALGIREAWPRIIQLWSWVARVAPDGDLQGLDDRTVARAAGWSGPPAKFVEALRSTGWLDPDGKLHGWLEYQGKYLERLEKDRIRKRTKEPATQPALKLTEPPAAPPPAAPTKTPAKERARDPDMDAVGIGYRTAFALGDGFHTWTRGEAVQYQAARKRWSVAEIITALQVFARGTAFDRGQTLTAMLNPARLEVAMRGQAPLVPAAKPMEYRKKPDWPGGDPA